MKNICIYYQSCPILSGKIQLKEGILNDYKKIYCNNGKEAWGLCKRYQVREIVGKCPLDILPDFPLSAEEIIEKYDL
jgi:hypothetical protein